MADSKLKDLTSMTAPAATDIMYIVDDPSGSALSQKMAMSVLQTYVLTDGTVTTALTFPNTGLHVLDTNASHDLIIAPGSNITADRTLTITTGDADRVVTLSGNLTVESASLVNQDLTTDASVQFAGIGLGGAASSSALIALTSAQTFSTGTGYTIYGTMPGRDVNSNETNNLLGVQLIPGTNTYEIANGATDSGYRMSYNVSAYANDAGFAGTLTAQYGVYIEQGIAAGAGTITSSYGLSVACDAISGTITTRYGIHVGDPSGAGTVTTNYGIYLADQTKGATDYAIYSAGGQSYFAGAMQICGDLTLSAADIVTDTTTGTKIGTAASQKLGFFNATPVTQQKKADHNNWAAVSDVVSALVNLGLLDSA